MRLAEHMARGLYAAWRLAGFRADGLAFLEPGGRGALRSFSAMLVAAPLYFTSLWLEARDPGAAAVAATPLSLLLIVYLVGWALFAFLMFHVARMLDLGGGFPRYLAAHNFCRVMAILAVLPANVILGFGLAHAAVGNLFLLVGGLYVLVLKGYVARTALGATTGQAVLLVMFEVVFFFTLESSVVRAFVPAAG